MYQSFTVSSAQMGRVVGSGRYFRVMQAVSDSVRCRFVFDDDVIETELPAGVGVPFSVPFKEVQVWGYGAAEEVKVMVHVLPIQDDRLNVSGPIQVGGVVSVDPVPAITYPDFMGTGGVNVGGTEYGNVALWNPSGSGVTLVLSNVWGSGNGAATVKMGYFSDISGWTLKGAGIDKSNHGGSSLAGVYALDSATVPAFDEMFSSRVKTDSGILISPARPFVIPEGKGVLFRTTALSVNTYASFDWEERPNV